MSLNVLSACDLGGKKLQKFVLISEDIGVDGSFLILSILGNCLKYQENGIVLVCLHHTSQHYSNAGARLGFNINMARDKGRIQILEPLADIANELLSSKFLTEPKGTQLQTFFTDISENIQKHSECNENVTLIIDNVTALHDLGYPVELITRFVHKIIELSSERVSIVLKVNACSLYNKLISNIEDYADSVISVNKLKSGEFQEVDGKIVYTKRSDNFNHTSKSILYKINDRNIKVFQPGEVGVRPS